MRYAHDHRDPDEHGHAHKYPDCDSDVHGDCELRRWDAANLGREWRSDV